jgi:hypothetical protein
VALSPSILPDPRGEKASNSEIVPMPQPHERPFPQEYVSSTQVQQPPSQENASVPPATPIKPTNQGRRPTNGPTPVQPTNPKRSNKKRNSLLPAFVGLFFVVVQLLLLVRFLLKFVGLMSNQPWTDTVYAVSEVFVWPWRILLQQIPLPASLNIGVSTLLPISINVEIYTLLAVLAYGLFSRLLVRLLKVLLNHR